MDEFINEESRIKEWSMETRKMVKSLKNHLIRFKKNVGLDFYDQNGIAPDVVMKFTGHCDYKFAALVKVDTEG